MAYGIVHQFPGGTQEQYEASIAVVHPSDGSLPEGQLFHAAGPSSEGWTIVAVHDSQESWERFRDEILMPSLSGASKAASTRRRRRRPSPFTISRLAKERLGLSASSRTVRLLRAGHPHTAWTVDHLDAAHARRAAARSGPPATRPSPG